MNLLVIDQSSFEFVAFVADKTDMEFIMRLSVDLKCSHRTINLIAYKTLKEFYAMVSVMVAKLISVTKDTITVITMEAMYFCRISICFQVSEMSIEFSRKWSPILSAGTSFLFVI